MNRTLLDEGWLIALVAVTFAFLRGGPSLEPSGGNGHLPGLPVKPIGNTAISHEGPTPALTQGDSLPQAADPIALGDRVLIGAVPRPGGGPPAPVALLAAVGDGAYRDIAEACKATIEVASHSPVDRKTAKTYAALFPIYQSLYGNLKSNFFLYK